MSRDTKFTVMILLGMLVSLILLLTAIQLRNKPLSETQKESPRDVFLHYVFDAYAVNFYETENSNSVVAHRRLTEKLAAVCRTGCDQDLVELVGRLKALEGDK